MRLSYVGVGMGLAVLVLSGTADFDRTTTLSRPRVPGLLEGVAAVADGTVVAARTKSPARQRPKADQPKDQRDERKAPKKAPKPHRGKFDPEDTPDTKDGETALAATTGVSPSPTADTQ